MQTSSVCVLVVLLLAQQASAAADASPCAVLWKRGPEPMRSPEEIMASIAPDFDPLDTHISATSSFFVSLATALTATVMRDVITPELSSTCHDPYRYMRMWLQKTMPELQLTSWLAANDVMPLLNETTGTSLWSQQDWVRILQTPYLSYVVLDTTKPLAPAFLSLYSAVNAYYSEIGEIMVQATLTRLLRLLDGPPTMHNALRVLSTIVGGMGMAHVDAVAHAQKYAHHILYLRRTQSSLDTSLTLKPAPATVPEELAHPETARPRCSIFFEGSEICPDILSVSMLTDICHATKRQCRFIASGEWECMCP